MARPQNTTNRIETTPETPLVEEETIPFHGICREGGGWSLYEFRIPKSWLSDAKQLRSVESLHGVLGHMRVECVREAERG
jgi:hypothetical protein